MEFPGKKLQTASRLIQTLQELFVQIKKLEVCYMLEQKMGYTFQKMMGKNGFRYN